MPQRWTSRSARGESETDEVADRRIPPPAERDGSSGLGGSLFGVLRTADAFLRRVVNACLSLVLIAFAAPVFLAIAILILVVDGRPILHKGTRLGLRKRRYTMYKFRTLARDASRKIGAELLSSKDRLTTRCGEFLRDTRLDELPQLFNVLKGDMNFVGPRPERPEVYDHHCHQIAGYDWRFAIKPGLVGYSQLFTPHGSPKRLRAIADSLVMRKAPPPVRVVSFVWCAALAVAQTVATRLLRYLWHGVLRTRILRLHSNRRKWRRRRPRNARVLIQANGGRTTEVRLVDISEVALLIEYPESIAASPILEAGDALKLRIEVRFRRRRASSGRMRVAHCVGRISHTRSTAGSWRHVVAYEPLTGWNQYVIDQYLLHTSLGRPFKTLPSDDANVGLQFDEQPSPRGQDRDHDFDNGEFDAQEFGPEAFGGHTFDEETLAATSSPVRCSLRDRDDDDRSGDRVPAGRCE